MTEATEPVEDRSDSDSEVCALKPKKTRSPEQLEVLKKAREKALQIRKENAKLRKAEKDIEKEKKDNDLKERKAKVAEHTRGAEIETEEVIVKQKKPLKKKKIIYVQESESESEDEIVIVKKRERTRGVRPTTVAPAKQKSKENYSRLYKQMFTL